MKAHINDARRHMLGVHACTVSSLIDSSHVALVMVFWLEAAAARRRPVQA
jgi:hypothetical protein